MLLKVVDLPQIWKTPVLEIEIEDLKESYGIAQNIRTKFTQDQYFYKNLSHITWNSQSWKIKLDEIKLFNFYWKTFVHRISNLILVMLSNLVKTWFYEK